MQEESTHGEAGQPGAGAAVQTINQARIIVFALIGGVLMFAVIAAVLGPGIAGVDDPEPREPMVPDLFLYVGLAVTAVTAGTAFFLRKLLASRVGRRRDAALQEIKNGMMPPELMSATIVGCALAEGGGMLGAVGMLLTGQYLYLVMPVVAIGVMALFIPTQTSMENLAHE